jgi:hypothetical protein
MTFIAIVWIGIAISYIYNLAQPVVTRKTRVTGKRTSIAHGPGQFPPHTQFPPHSGQLPPHTQFPPHTTYLCAFEFEDGQRAEYAVSAFRYGLIAEGDRGELDTRGTLFCDFRREAGKST